MKLFALHTFLYKLSEKKQKKKNLTQLIDWLFFYMDLILELFGALQIYAINRMKTNLIVWYAIKKSRMIFVRRHIHTLLIVPASGLLATLVCLQDLLIC